MLLYRPSTDPKILILLWHAHAYKKFEELLTQDYIQTRNSRLRMSSLIVHNVNGDGHCFYRCIWNIIKDHPEIFHGKLCDVPRESHKDREYDMVYKLRTSVASCFLQDEDEEFRKDDKLYSLTRTCIENIKVLERSGFCQIQNYYPFYQKHDDQDDDEDDDDDGYIYFKSIAHTNVMASHVEVHIMKELFHQNDVELIVVNSENINNRMLTEMSEKWKKDLTVILQHSIMPTKYVAILVNEENIHYRYVTFQARAVFLRKALCSYIDTKTKIKVELAE